MTRSRESVKDASRAGFTLIEVMLFLAISGLLLVGVLGGTYSAIGIQRYNDSLRSFAEFLRQTYGEVISPESLGAGNSNHDAVYGKLLVFGLEGNRVPNTIYSATIVGNVDIPHNQSGFMSELKSVEARLFCGNTEQSSTLSSYIPLWESRILKASDSKLNQNSAPFVGSIIIARSPTSGTVHTAYSTETFNLRDNCSPENTSASTQFKDYVNKTPEGFSANEDLDFCLLSENSNIVRDVRLTADGRNTSAINILTADEGGSRCH